MKKLSVLISALILALLLSGCSVPELFARLRSGEAPEAEAAITVCRIAASPAGAGDLLRFEAYPADGAVTSQVGEYAAAFASPSLDDGLRCALPEGVTLEDWTLENGVVTLTLSPAFLEQRDMDRTLASFAAVLTLCQLDEVDAVTVAAGDRVLFSGLTPEDALLTDTAADPFVRQLRLYYPDENGRYLISEYHSLTLDENASPERYVVEELIRGPNSGELLSPLPPGTRLLSCSTENGLCTVDLSREFLDNRPDTALGERLTIYALVDSLAALSGVSRVRILAEGRPIDTYVCRSLADPLEPYDEVVGPVSTPRGETDVDLYLPLPGLEDITPLPFRVSGAGDTSLAEAALDALLTRSEPGYPSLFSGGGSIVDVQVQGSLCTIDLAESFFVSLPAEARGTAVRAMAATVCALPGIQGVRFTVGGGDAVFDGVDWSGPWQDYKEIEVK